MTTTIPSLQIPGRRAIERRSVIRLTGGGNGGPHHNGVFCGERGLCRVGSLDRDDDGRTWADVCFIAISKPDVGKSNGQPIGRIMTVLLAGPPWPHPSIPNYLIRPYQWHGSNKSFEEGTAT